MATSRRSPKSAAEPPRCGGTGVEGSGCASEPFFQSEARSLCPPSAWPPQTHAAMLAAASYRPHVVGAAVDPLDSESWGLDASRSPPQHAMKLLDLDNVRSLVLRNLDVCRKGPSTMNDDQAFPRVPETDSDPNYVTEGVAGPSDVNKLLALDVEELVRHTCRVQRERRAAAYVRLESYSCVGSSRLYCVIRRARKFVCSNLPHGRMRWKTRTRSVLDAHICFGFMPERGCRTGVDGAAKQIYSGTAQGSRCPHY